MLVLRDGGDGRDRAGDRAAARLEEQVAQAGGGSLAAAFRLDPESLTPTPTASPVACGGAGPGGRARPARTAATGLARWSRAMVWSLTMSVSCARRPVSPPLSDAPPATSSGSAGTADTTRSRTASRSGWTRGAGEGRAAADEAVAAARTALDAARRARRVADETDRSVASAAERGRCELAWQEALLERAAAEAATAAEEARPARCRASRPTTRAPGAVWVPVTRCVPRWAAVDVWRALRGRAERDAAARAAGETRAARDRAMEDQHPPVNVGARRGPHSRRSSPAMRSPSVAATPTSSPSASVWGRGAGAAQARQKREAEAFEASVSLGAGRAQPDLLAAEEAASAGVSASPSGRERASRRSEVGEIGERALPGRCRARGAAGGAGLHRRR